MLLLYQWQAIDIQHQYYSTLIINKQLKFLLAAVISPIATEKFWTLDAFCNTPELGSGACEFGAIELSASCMEFQLHRRQSIAKTIPAASFKQL